MNYKAAYNRLISFRTSNPINGYSEKHHIIPRSLGGSDATSNLVRLSAREHFLAHLLLAKIYGGNMWAALAYMARGNTRSASGVRITSRQYETIKKKDAEWRSVRYLGEGNPFKGKKHSIDTCLKMRGLRESVSGVNHHFYGKKRPDVGAVISAVRKYSSRVVHVDLTVRDRIDELVQSSGRGVKKLSEYYRRVIAGKTNADSRDLSGERNPNFGNGQAISGNKNPMFGKEHKESTKLKIAEKAKRTLECPHCGKVSNIANAHRWHFDKCKRGTNKAT